MIGDVTKITVRVGDDDAPPMEFRGRSAWALAALVAAGDEGCTPITKPAPRWSHYTYLLRRAGIAVETVTEAHGGAYAGHHARYVLRVPVQVLAVEQAGA